MTELKQVTRKDWVEALRSGTYSQADSVLFDSDSMSYCCLGVACALAGVDLSNEMLTNPYSGEEDDLMTSSLNQWVETAPVFYMLNLGQKVPDNRELQMVVAAMNDRGDSFKRIADYIESLEVA